MIDTNKKYRTRDGREARVICTDRKSHDFPVVALINENGEEDECSFTIDGRFVDSETESDNDLIEVREPHAVWLNEYAGDLYLGYESEKCAKEMANEFVIRKAVKYIEAIEP